MQNVRPRRATATNFDKTSKSKAKRIYLECREELSSYYEEIGFLPLKKIPKGLEKHNQECDKLHCALNTKGTWFAYDKKKLKDTSFEAKPSLIVIDGGKGQLKVGERALKNFKLQIPVISIAKKKEEIFQGTKKIILPQTSPALKLVQRVRDEAHRFAIEFQRSKRKF